MMDDYRRLRILRSNSRTIGLPGAARPSLRSRCSRRSKTVNRKQPVLESVKCTQDQRAMNLTIRLLKMRLSRPEG